MTSGNSVDKYCVPDCDWFGMVDPENPGDACECAIN